MTNRRRDTKINTFSSDWHGTTKGLPNQSILGPLLFNLFSNVFFYAFKK